MRSIRFALLAALPLALTACASPPRVDVTAGNAPFVLEKYFAGTTFGEGVFTSPISGVNRPLKMVAQGNWNGHTLTLVENIAYADGERDRKTWRITKTGPGVYEGLREDVVGKADIRQEGDTVTLRYTVDVASKKDGSVTRLDFADTLAVTGPGRAINRATVSKFGVPVGTVDISFAKRR